VNRPVTRREFLGGMVAVAAGGLALTSCDDDRSRSPTTLPQLPDPSEAGFDHVVVVMMENRSFDHFLGWVPGADGVQAGVTLVDIDGAPQTSFDLAPSFQNCNLADPDHTYAGGRIEINEGKMDGFLLTQPSGDKFPIGYYTAESLPFFKGCAENWTICDRYFSGILALTTPNRIYMHAGQTDRIANSVKLSSLPTIWDRMLGAGRTVAYYYADVSYTSFWGSKYSAFSKRFTRDGFAADVANGPLADLTFVDNVGSVFNEGGAVSQDDHPYGDIRDGQAFLNSVYDALRTGPSWGKTLLIINYDEWGGFYDHVTPPFAPVSDAERALGNDGRLGCRVPCVIVGPLARRRHVDHTQFDPNSILNMLAWRFGFEPLGVRGSSINIAHALDFSGPPDLSAPAFDVPRGPFGGICVPLPLLVDLLGISAPVPLPEIPVVPDPLQLQLPPIPGLDVPAERFLDYQQELQDLRVLGKQFGF